MAVPALPNGPDGHVAVSESLVSGGPTGYRAVMAIPGAAPPLPESEAPVAEDLYGEDVRRLVQEGLESPTCLDAEAVFARLRAKFGQPPAG